MTSKVSTAAAEMTSTKRRKYSVSIENVSSDRRVSCSHGGTGWCNGTDVLAAYRDQQRCLGEGGRRPRPATDMCGVKGKRGDTTPGDCVAVRGARPRGGGRCRRPTFVRRARECRRGPHGGPEGGEHAPSPGHSHAVRPVLLSSPPGCLASGHSARDSAGSWPEVSRQSRPAAPYKSIAASTQALSLSLADNDVDSSSPPLRPVTTKTGLRASLSIPHPPSPRPHPPPHPTHPRHPPLPQRRHHDVWGLCLLFPAWRP